ncbi:MAG TPA: pyridoxal 5'-phosphate synthase glutaminase subunit PdxT [Candidatus Acidoferrum sp.]|jgi:5'-phosphate synthase pdxT subunit|nr:pyridoxal 5'-phosphate synthase glutaminase subunit PdxT [Candidatus Acidoferrum sp.]
MAEPSSIVGKPNIGILAIQGDFAAHAAVLHSLGAQTTEVRTIADLQQCHALILPGGESTTQLQFLQEEGLGEEIKKFAAKRPVFGTCAGAILLAARVNNPAQDSLGLLDMTILRNGYGRQLASEVSFGNSKLKSQPMEMVFIRAPIIESVGPGVEVLAEFAGKPSLVQKGNILAATFHPELTTDFTVHQHFLGLIKNASALTRAHSPEGKSAGKKSHSTYKK